jgi:hypothetical protein
MDLTTNDEAVFRGYEAILDSHHRTLALWQRPRPKAIFTLLAAFDLHVLPIMLGIGAVSENPGSVQYIKSTHDGLIHALRFFWQDAQNLGVEPAVDSTLVAEGFDFLKHCADYAVLADFHAGFGRGHYSLEVCEQRKTIKFVPNPGRGAGLAPAGMLEATPREWDVLRVCVADAPMMAQTMDLLGRVPHHTEAGRFVIDDFESLGDPVMKKALEYLTQSPGWGLTDSDDLAGMTVKVYRTFWQALYAWSTAVTVLYLTATSKGKPQDEHLPTQHVTHNSFIDAIKVISGLSADDVRSCIDRLSFGSQPGGNPDVFLQPLLSAGNHIAWSPHLISLCKYERNALKLMTRTPAMKPVADNLIGRSERVLSQQVGALLSAAGYQYKPNIKLPDNLGEIDLLAYRAKQKSELLIFELKAVLGVDEINEVENVTREAMKGQAQLRKVVGYLKSAGFSAKTALWKGAEWQKINSYFGIVMTPDAPVSTNYDHTEFPAVTFEAASRYFTKSDYRSPRKIWLASRDKRWLDRYRNCELAYRTIEVGDIRYEIPVQVFGDG